MQIVNLLLAAKLVLRILFESFEDVLQGGKTDTLTGMKKNFFSFRNSI